MKRLLFSPAAQDDIEKIYDYTLKIWGIIQAEHYVSDIRDTCRDLASGKREGSGASAIRPGYFKKTSGSHFIFYRLPKPGIMEVVRILHQRMDIESHL
ncbi:MAG: type II toxin-antitoxin system RelE/ParE family toxin [Proteobacteria bacterium]|nr:type II toxin-antitoxin system RelE/ParE family toxin [Pseudomonadota bacterium]